MKTPNSSQTFKQLQNTRFGSKTPKFFRIVRNVGLAATGIGAIILGAPVTLPAAIITAGSFLVSIGATASTISQFAKE